MRARALRTVLAATCLVALSSVALADAPGDQYDLFDQDNQAIDDLRTGLTWQRYPADATVSLDEATGGCAMLSTPGYTGTWRLPSYKELLTIVDEQPHVEYENGSLSTKAIDGNAFPGAPSGSYWTSSPLIALGQQGGVYGVNFSTGAGEPHTTSESLYVRCVTP